MLLGAVAVGADVLIGLADGRGSETGAVFFGVSFGALIALTAFGPLALLLALSPFPRTGPAKLAGLVGAVVTAPVALLLGRWLYKQIPWSAADVLLGVAGVLGLVAAAAAIGAGLHRLVGRRGEGIVRGLSFAALPLLVMTAPAALRILPALGPPVPSRSGDPNPHHLLLLTVDTLRADRIGAYGAPDVRTPWIDRLARRSVQWTDCVSPSPWTLPSLGSLLTGTYPGEHRVLESLSAISEEVPALAEVCRDEGMRTAAFVSNPWLATGSLGRGFDSFDVAERLECLWTLRGTRLYPLLTKALLRGLSLDRADRLSEQAVAWIRHGDGAWFLWVHYFDPHLPNWPAAPWDRLTGPPPTRIGSSLTVEEIREDSFREEAERADEVARLYDGEVAYTDWGLGRVLGFLERTGRRDETAIVFSADHGEELWDHAGYGHGHTMFEEVVRVPLLVSRPGTVGGPRNVVRTDLARLLDVPPTGLAAAELPVPPAPAFSGVDLLSARVDTTYGEATLYGDEQKYLRTNVWKLVLRPDSSGGGPIRLFDLAADPAEFHDLADARPDVADSLRAELARWRERVGSDGAMAARDVPSDLDPSIREQLESLGYIDRNK